MVFEVADYEFDVKNKFHSIPAIQNVVYNQKYLIFTSDSCRNLTYVYFLVMYLHYVHSPLNTKRTSYIRRTEHVA